MTRVRLTDSEFLEQETKLIEFCQKVEQEDRTLWKIADRELRNLEHDALMSELARANGFNTLGHDLPVRHM